MKFAVWQSMGDEGEQWRELINRLPAAQRDIHFLPEYAAIYQKTFGYQPYLAWYEDNDRFILQPFVKRNLNCLPFLKDQHIQEDKFDIANAYGYGGPLASSPNLALMQNLAVKFNQSFHNYCDEEKIASEFGVCHPLLGNYQLINALGLEAIYQKKVVYIDLDQSETQIWQGLRKGHQRNITKARKYGVKIEKIEPTTTNLKILNELYCQTMRRNNAAERWFLPETFFQNCFDFLGPQRCSLFFAIVKDQVATASIFIHDYSILYYHFGGSDSTFSEYAPSILLLYTVALWGKKQGYHRFHLGGGVSVELDDSLFHFKVGFSKDFAPLYIFYRVHHRATYEQLCELKKKYERQIRGSEIDSDYFPLYRR